MIELGYRDAERVLQPLRAASITMKSGEVQKVADQHSPSKKDVKSVIESLASVGYKELKKNGAFLLPGFAKFVVIKKPATKERAGINPSEAPPALFQFGRERGNSCHLIRARTPSESLAFSSPAEWSRQYQMLGLTSPYPG